LLALVVATLVPALLLSTFLLRRVAGENRASLDRQMLYAARAEAAVVDAEITGAIRALQALALSPQIRRGDLASFHAEATAFQQSQPSWFRIILTDRQSVPLVNTGYAMGQPLPPTADHDSLQELYRTGLPAVGNLRRGNGRDQQFAFTVRVPVAHDNVVAYALSAVILPGSLVNIIRQQAPASEELVRGVVDRNGTVIARSPDPENFIGRQATPDFLAARTQGEGVTRITGLDGRRVYSAFSTAPVSGWVAAVAIPESAVDDLGAGSVPLIVASSFGLLVVGGLFAFAISRRITKDIEAAATAADVVASGEEPEVPASRVSEVRQLAEGLRRSAAMLEARERERDEHILRADQARQAADQARDAAESANRAKDDFLATLGHELRNPLAPALTALHLMRLRGDTGGQREREIIERQVQHLARLVDDLLDVSRARAGRLEIRKRPFELIHAIETAVEIAGPLIALRGHTLTLDLPRFGLAVNGDETRLAQVFGNLLNNAAKHTDHPVQIVVRARVEGDMVIVTCADTGQGIDAQLLPRVFDHFSQGAQSIERRQGGLGLGLAVVKTLVELHGGSVRADSGGPGTGSTFTVQLPRAEAAAGAVAGSDAEPAMEGGDRRVLIVDDNKDAAEMLADIVRIRGYRVAVTHDGVSALKANDAFRANVAILDIGLPGMNGLELARRLRASADGRTIRLVAVTGYGQQSDVEASRAAGFDVHLVKPVTAEKLFDAISTTH
jgi:signal transduction histidine kinase/CheY-like chemotaxis protein